MSQKIESANDQGGKRTGLVSSTLLIQLCVITLLALLALVALERFVITGARARTEVLIDSPLVYPWVTASNTTLGYALLGIGVSPPSIFSVKIYLLAGILLTFVICPTIVLYGWYKRRLARLSGTSQPIGPLRNLSSLGYSFCSIVVLFVVVTIVPLTILQMVKAKSSCESDEARLLRYQTENELNLVISNIVEYRLLPKELSGGGGSFQGYVVPTRLARTDKAEYSVKVKSDTVLVKAESALCATNTISATVDRHGLAGMMMYEGNWGYG